IISGGLRGSILTLAPNTSRLFALRLIQQASGRACLIASRNAFLVETLNDESDQKDFKAAEVETP
ncbi:hypothetical protein, partial [Mesorhizobium sp.]|uniref:hypothetical protein n=1 Tax=Mesorhizobium sp. TaxID=1871066 RepID=UPI0025F2D51B